MAGKIQKQDLKTAAELTGAGGVATDRVMSVGTDLDTSTGHRHDGSTDGRKIRGTDIDSGAATNGQVLTANGSGGNTYTTIGTITSKDEGSTLTTATTSINYVGAGVTATNTDGAVTVTIPGSSSITVKDEGSTLTTALTSMDFVGAGVTATNTGGAVTVTIGGGGSGANTALSNLASVAINTALLPGTDNSIDDGSATKRWAATHALSNKVYGSTSGVVTVKGQAAAGTYNYVLPTSMGSSGQYLTTDGTNSSWASIGTIPAAKNYCINGNFDIAQRVGVGGSATVSGANTFALDRFVLRNPNATAIGGSVSQDTTVFPTYAQSGFFSNYSIFCALTGVIDPLAANDNIYLQYSMFESELNNFYGNSMTISFWHRYDRPGTYTFALNTISSGIYYIKEYTQAVSATWEKATITIPISTSNTYNGGNLNRDNEALRLIWTFASGTTKNGTANAWTSGSKNSTTNQVNNFSSDGAYSANLYLSQVKIEVGTSASTFTRAGDTVEEEIRMCYNDYQKSYSKNVSVGSVDTGNSEATHVYADSVANATRYQNVRFPVPMRSAPTVNIWGVGGTSGTVSNSTGTDLGANSGTVNRASTKMFEAYNNSGGALTTTNKMLEYHWDAATGF